jgi:hypothetical protein
MFTNAARRLSAELKSPAARPDAAAGLASAAY